MGSVADMGGTEGWGPVRPPRAGEPVFAQRWQARTFGLALLAIRVAGQNMDAFRHSLDRLGREAYFGEGYAGRWLNGAELLLTDSAILAPAAVDARARNLRGEHVGEPAIPQPARPEDTPGGPGSLRTVDAAPAFRAGQRVRTRNLVPTGHTRLPRYLRGHAGVVDLVQPAAVLPDTNAHHLGENAQYVYSVRFEARELWGAAAEPFAVTADLYESYLEAAA